VARLLALGLERAAPTAEETEEMNEAFTDPQLLELVAAMAVELSERYGWPDERATKVVGDYAAKARQQYRAEGALFGDDEHGLYCWLTELLHEREA
jgi:hypothetical protein